MKITDHIQESAFGNKTNFRLYEPENGSRNYVIFLHGIGECGPADGSNINEITKYGWPKAAENGFEFPFNIVAPQVISSYSGLKKFLPAYLKIKYKAEKIVVTGLSMGGYGTYDFKLFDSIDGLNLIDAIAPVCGAGDIRMLSSFPEMDAWHFHGTNDGIVKFATAKKFIDAYNESHVKQIKLTAYEGIGHNSWNNAYSLSTAHDNPNLYQWVLERFTDN